MTVTNSRAAAWAGVERLLLVRLDNLGDALMTTPAIRACTAPGRLVTLLASSAGAALGGRLRGVDEVWNHDASWVSGPGSAAEGCGNPASLGGANVSVDARRDDARAERRLIAALRRGRFDAAVIFTVCTQSALPAALICRLAGIPLRLAHARENPYALLTDRCLDTDVVSDGMRHEVRRQLDLVESVGYTTTDERLGFELTPEDERGAAQRLSAAGGNPALPYAIVHVGASAPSRRYPPERFAQAAARLRQKSGLQVVVCGGPSEQSEVRATLAAFAAHGGATACGRAVGIAGLLNLGELGALIHSARLLICNNSGPSHLAAACGTPVVVAYAQTNPQHTPWQVAARVLTRDVSCQNCLRSRCPVPGHPCLLGIDAEEIADAALDLLNETCRTPIVVPAAAAPVDRTARPARRRLVASGSRAG